MKKAIAFLGAAALLVGSLAGCGSSSSSGGSSSAASTQAASTAQTTAVDASTDTAEASTETSADASSGDTYTFKVALQNGEQHPLSQGVAKFGDILEEKSGGRMKLDIYYSGSLGDKATTVQGLQTGTIDAAMLMGGVIADYGCDELKVFSLPYLFDSVDQARNFEKSDEGQKVLDTVESSGSGMVCIGTYQESARNYFFKNKKVEKPADMKNLQIRCQEGSIYNDAVEALGAYSQSIAFSELYSALQSGVVDGAEQPLSGYVTNAFQEVSKYYVLDQHEISPNLVLFSKATWDKLSDDDKAIIKEAFSESVPEFEKISDAKDDEYMQQIKDAGVEVINVNIEDWQKACQSVYDKYGDQYKDVIAAIKATK